LNNNWFYYYTQGVEVYEGVRAHDGVSVDNPLGDNKYQSNYTELPDERIAYIGDSTRDHLACWVVDKQEQPGFQYVSPLFERDGKWCYYAVIGRHLYTMQIPDKEEQ